MPIYTISLLTLNTPIPTFLSRLLHPEKTSPSSSPIKPLLAARVLRWIIPPSSPKTSTPQLTSHPWDLLLILPDSPPLPSHVKGLISAEWRIRAGVPAGVIAAFNHHREERPVPEVPVAESVPKPSSMGEKKKVRDLELDEELRGWIEGMGGGGVSMLNLLAFRPGMKARYLEYGKAFAEDVGKRWGGRAKLVGKVIDGGEEEGGWDEVALAHYPSLQYFAHMLASADYQRANHEWRLSSLRDTCILCTSEVDLGGVDGGDSSSMGGAKL